MRRRLVLAAICMLILPAYFESHTHKQIVRVAPFATTALAGHALPGGWCECGAPGCICDPGEEPTYHSAQPVSDDSPVKGAPKTKRGRFADLDFGAGALLIALSVLMWSRLRA